MTRRNWTRAAGAAAGVGFAIAFATPAEADVIHVPGDHATIQAAIDASESGDEIVVASGLYEETIDFGGRDVHVRSSDGAAVTTIDPPFTGELYRPVVRFESGEGAGAILEGFTLSGGTGVPVGELESVGGGVYIDGADPCITDCVITANSGFRGAGVYIGGDSAATLNGCTISSHVATVDGGGVMIVGSDDVTISGCTFEDNRTTMDDSRGGGLYVDACSPTVSDCTFNLNIATYGGGVYIGQGSPTLIACVFTGNTTHPFGIVGYGGAVASDGGTCTVTDCSFSENATDGDGGAVYGAGGSLILGGCEISYNTAEGKGGAIMVSGSSLELTDCVLLGNGAATGEAVMAEDAQTVVTGCHFGGNGYAVAGDLANGGAIRVDRAAPGVDYGLEVRESTFGNNIADGSGGAIYVTDSPMLITGSTFSGNDVVHGGGAGVYFYGPSAEVTDCSFTDNWARTGGGGGGLQLHATVSGEVTDCTFTSNPGGGGGVISGPVTVSRCSFVGNGSYLYGGGLYVWGGVAVDDCTFSGNFAADDGGGMFTCCGPVVVSNSQFTGNVASRGGGIALGVASAGCVANCTFVDNWVSAGSDETAYGGGAFVDGDDVVFMNAVFRGNRAGLGGALATGEYFLGTVTLAQATLYDNRAHDSDEYWQSGNGLYVPMGTAVVRNSILRDAPVDEVGGWGMVTIDASNVWGGWWGSGAGNIDADPQFLDAPGGDLRLSPCSPSVDAGFDAAVPADLADLDGDGDTAEACPFDMLMQTRIAGDPVARVDMGAYELQPCPGDTDLDGRVGHDDLAAVLDAWGSTVSSADVDCDGAVDVNDIVGVIIGWGGCGP